MEFQMELLGITLINGAEVFGIDVYAHGTPDEAAVDALQAVSAGDPQNRYRPRAAGFKRLPEQFRKGAQLRHAGGTHVAFVVRQRNGQPGIRHASILQQPLGWPIAFQAASAGRIGLARRE